MIRDYGATAGCGAGYSGADDRTLEQIGKLFEHHLVGSQSVLAHIPHNIKLAFEYVSRTPADKPIVCAALAQWNSGRTRLALGGYGKSPMLAMDGTEAEGVDTSSTDYVLRSVQTAARNAFHEATDEWASAEYRMDVASTLAKRCLEGLN